MPSQYGAFFQALDSIRGSRIHRLGVLYLAFDESSFVTGAELVKRG